MKKILLRVWFGLGSVVIIFVTSILVLLVRLLKIVTKSKTVVKPEKDIFKDSRRQPLPSVLVSEKE